MNVQYDNSFKNDLCKLICLGGASTMNTAKEYNVPLKTLEKWITAYHKNPCCFDSENNSNNFKIISPNINQDINYDDVPIDELKKELMKKDIEIARLKKNYLVKEGGTGEKVFVSLSKKNTK